MGKRNRYSSPISLFSFQDIITSLTGIMFLIVLLMTLIIITRELKKPQLADTPAALPVAISEHRTRAETLRMLREITAQLEQRRQQLRELTARLDQLNELDPAALEQRLLQQEQAVAALEQQLAAAELQLAANQEQIAAMEQLAQNQLTELNALPPRIKEAQQRLSQLSQQLQQLQQQQKILEQLKKILVKQPHAAKLPIIVECREASALILDVQSAKPQQQAMPPENAAAGVEQLARQLNRFDPDKHYLVLLITRESYYYIHELIAAVTQSGFEHGWEPWDSASSLIQPPDGKP